MRDYDKIPAGREMDALVADKVFGMVLSYSEDGIQRYDSGTEGDITMWMENVADYSTSISAAWKVVEWMSSIPMGGFTLTEQRDGWLAHWPGVDVFAPTAALAICRAALKAVGG